MFRKIGFIVLCLVCGMILLSACSSNALSEAKQTVAQADSVWAEGGMYSDSLSLAQAYETLGHLSPFNFHLSPAYVHACYHYGKLLRDKDDPVSAMLVFINATHVGSDDKQILGRIYNNMGDICHRANEFSLSYDMFKRSAEVFLSDKDTLSYYYCLNDMAFELAEQGKKEETLDLLNKIKYNEYNDSYLYGKILETKADVYRKAEQFDSAVYVINKNPYNYLSTNRIIKAQSFYKLHLFDSAMLYANMVLSDSLSSYQNRFNALFILTHADSSVNSNELRILTSQREDIRFYEHDPEKEKLTLAINLLENELNRKPDLTWLYAILITLFFIGTCIFIYVHKKKKRHQLLSQQIEDLESKNQDTLSQRRKQIEAKCMMLANSSSLKETLCWNDFEMLCKNVDTHFYMLAEKLRQKHILNEQEIRLCILVLLNISRNQIAEILLYAPNGVGKFKYRVAQKFQVEGKNLRNYLICLAIDEPYK